MYEHEWWLNLFNLTSVHLYLYWLESNSFVYDFLGDNNPSDTYFLREKRRVNAR